MRSGAVVLLSLTCVLPMYSQPAVLFSSIPSSVPFGGIYDSPGGSLAIGAEAIVVCQSPAKCATNQAEAMGFTPTINGKVGTIELGILSATPSGISAMLNIALTTSVNGVPGATLETYTASLPFNSNAGTGSGPLLTVTSVLQPTLNAGQMYWLTVSVSPFTTFSNSASGFWSFSSTGYPGPVLVDILGVLGNKANGTPLQCGDLAGGCNNWAPLQVSLGGAFRVNAVSTSNALTLGSLRPNSVTAGDEALTMTVSGSGFIPASTTLWNGTLLPTSYLSDTQLTASVGANLIASQGSASINVQNPGGIVSNSLPFTINPRQSSALTILTASPLPNGAVGVPYSQGLSATGGSTPYKGWAVASGSLPLPAGISVSQGVLPGTGLLSGTPTTVGTFSFTLQVTDNANVTATKQYTLEIAGGSTTISDAGIVNAASYAGGAISPGEIITIFGSFSGPPMLVSLKLDSRGYVSTDLGGMEVLFDGVQAPMIYALAGQVSCVVPYEVSGKSSTQVQVSYQGQLSDSVTEPVADAVPGVFTINSSGSGPGAIVNQDGTLNSASNPAAIGSTVSVYATGEGQTNPAGVDGRPDSAPLPQPVTQPVTATVGGLAASVEYAGGVSGLVAGVLQVNVQIPQGVSPGNAIPVTLTIGGVTSQANVTVAVTTGSGSQSLAIKSVSTSSPGPLTPLYLGTTGLNPSAPVTLRFFSSSGFSLTEQAIRTAADGTVTAAVPIYVNSSGQSSGGSVSLVVSQGDQSSAPVILNIKDLPALNAYGTQLGQISRAVLILDAILVGRRLNELQAFQALPTNTVNTSQAQSTLQTLLNAIIGARSDVDQISLNNSVVINSGNLTDGTPVQFDQVSLDLMDRINAVFLTQTFASLVSPAVQSTQSLRILASPVGPRSSINSRLGRFEFSSTEAPRATAHGESQSVSSILTTILNMDTLLAATTISSGASSVANAQNLADQVAALVGGEASLGAALSVLPKKQNEILGALGAVISDIQIVGMSWGDLGAFLVGLATHNQSLISTAIDAMNALPRQQLYQTLGDLTLAFPGLQEIEALKPVSSVLNLIETESNIEQGQGLQSADSTTEAITTSYTAPSVYTQGIASITGVVNVQSNNGIATPQTGAQLSSNGITFGTIADLGGDYQLYVPLQVIGFDYSTATFTIVDPLGPLGSQVLNLDDLTTEAPLQMPAIGDQCSSSTTFAMALACVCAMQIPNTIGYWIACE
jgi:uncharacterized protein (TIGR03437 family)